MKVGLCGLGPMGRSHVQLLTQHGDIELVAVADVQEAPRKEIGEQFGVSTYESGEALIDAKIADVIFVCAPTYLHSPLTVRALEAGHHVFCEKPMSRTPEECMPMIEASERTGKMLTIGQVLRFWPEYVFLKNAIDGGEYGKLQTLSMTRVGGVSTGFERWFLDEDRGGMQIFDRHIHDTDLTLWMLGRPKSVQSFGFEMDARTEGGIVHSFTRYKFDDVAVSAEGSADLPAGYPFTMSYTAVFDNAAIEYDNRQSPTLSLFDGSGDIKHPELPSPLGDLQAGLNISSSSGYFLEQAYLFDCIRNGVKPEIVTPRSAMETIEVVRAEIASVRQGGAPIAL
ncbi:MAG: Gfo/Idh/MocA family oxidoreductase [Lentisphaeria bacterium]|nr:Gfo/Idh/MocA family oxidoreductase [Lentisphaeria bacterium]